MLPPRVRRWFRLEVHDPARLAEDVDDEIAFHLEQRTEQLVRRGLSPQQARAEALHRFGPSYLGDRGIHAAARHREDRMRLGQWRDALAHDIRYGLRTLRGAPGFTAVVTLTLALGIGATTAIVAVIDAVLIRPLAYPTPERLVVLSDVQGDDVVPASYPEFIDWRTRGGHIFDAVGAYSRTGFTLTGTGEPEVLSGARVSAEVPRMLGMTMVRGRALGADDDLRASPLVVVISEGLWQRRFGGDAGVVGRTLALNGNSWTVVGIVRSDHRAVLPHGVASGERTEVWMPLRLDESVAPRGLHFITVLAQLSPGVSVAAGRSRVDELATRLRADGVTEHGIALTPLTERLLGDVRPRLTLLFAAVGMVLLIACANVANLLLARAAVRRREIAVRIAIGAGPARVATQLLIESILRALLGGVLGIGVAYGSLALVRAWLPGRIPRADEIAVDARVLLFAVLLSVVTGLLFGLLPALGAAWSHAAATLREGGRGLSGGRGRELARRALVSGEVALSFVLLVAAGLLIRSFGRLSSVETGFDADRAVTAGIVLPQSRYPDAARRTAFFQDLLDRAGRLPGVRGVALTNDLPVQGGTSGGFSIEGRTFPPDADPLAEKRIVSTEYFDVLGVRLIEGRTFDRRDGSGAPPVMIVNESFARAHFPGASAVGQRVGFLWGIEGMQTVVGVIADIREGALDGPALPAMYVNVAQRSNDAMHLIVRAAGDPIEVIPALRRTVLEIDPNLPLAQVRTLADVVTSGIGGRRLLASLVGVFSIVALLLASIGLYGVVSFSVAQRTHELGIRTALGARGRDIVRLVLGQGVTLIAFGLAAGALIALVSGRFLANQLYGIAANDATTLVVVAAVLAAVGIAAAAIPAVRAARIDPMLALRHE